MKTKYTLLAIGLTWAVTIKAQTSYIIPDGKNEAPGVFTYIENKGQELNHIGNACPEVKYSCKNAQTKLWALNNGEIRFSYLEESLEDSIPDTLLSIGMQPIEEGIHPNGVNIVSENSTGVVSNYYLPHCGAGGIENALHYQRLTWPNVAPHIHQQLYSNADGYKLYYIIEPGGDPSRLHIEFTGQDQIQVSGSKMNILIGQATLVLDAAVAYQINSSNQVVPLSWIPTFVDEGNGIVGVSTGTYNSNQKLVLQIAAAPAAPANPVTYPGNMQYSSYLNGDQNDHLTAIATHPSSGHIYLAMESTSSKYPNFIGKQVRNQIGNIDVVLLHFNSDMVAQEYTYFGSADADQVVALDFDNSGNVWIAGNTSGLLAGNTTNTKPSGSLYTSGFVTSLTSKLSKPNSTWYGSGSVTSITDMQITKQNKIVAVGFADQTTTQAIPLVDAGNGAYYQDTIHDTLGGSGDGFIFKMNLNRTIEHSTWFGSDAGDRFIELDVDSTGKVYALMHTYGNHFANPVWSCSVTTNRKMPNCYHSSSHFSYWTGNRGKDDYYVAVFNSNMSLYMTTYLGSKKSEGFGIGDIKADPHNLNRFYVALTSENASTFALSRNPTGYVGGIPKDGENNIIVYRFENDTIMWHSYLGCDGSYTFSPHLGFDSDSNVYVAGQTTCPNGPLPSVWCQAPYLYQYFPICDNGGANLFIQDVNIRNNTGSTTPEGFVTTFNTNNQLIWSTFFGGNGIDEYTSIHIDENLDRVYVVGNSIQNSSNGYIPTRKLNVSGSHFQAKPSTIQSGMVSWFSTNFTLSVESIESNNWQIAVFPNPSSSWLHIKHNQQEAHYELFDLSGRKITVGKLTPEVNAISVHDLSTGTYLLNVKSGQKQATVKFIKQ